MRLPMTASIKYNHTYEDLKMKGVVLVRAEVGVALVYQEPE